LESFKRFAKANKKRKKARKLVGDWIVIKAAKFAFGGTKSLEGEERANVGRDGTWQNRAKGGDVLNE